jgi:hypothetical protein
MPFPYLAPYFVILKPIMLKQNLLKRFCRSQIENGEDARPQFDENQESWVTMSNQIIICLYGVTSSLALVCVFREGIQKIRGPTVYNLNLFRKAIRETLQR